ncbi:MAG: hypothetical protein RIB98_09655 [Acidimicrobiales bacterium]
MEIRTIVLILLRRWYVAVPIAVLALWFAAGSGGQPTYSVEASFLLVTNPSTTTEDAAASNPIIETPSAVNSVANVAVVVMQTEARRTAVAEAGFSPSYGFSVARDDPFVNLELTDDDPELAIETAAALTRLFVEEMDTQQTRFGADATALVRAELLEISEPTADYSGVRTSQLTVAVAGLLFAFVAAFAVEGIVYFFSDRRIEFRELHQYEGQAAQFGTGGESAAEFRPDVGPVPIDEPPEQAAIEEGSNRWVRARRDRPAEN